MKPIRGSDIAGSGSEAWVKIDLERLVVSQNSIKIAVQLILGCLHGCREKSSRGIAWLLKQEARYADNLHSVWRVGGI